VGRRDPTDSGFHPCQRPEPPGGELDNAMKDIKKGLNVAPEDGDLKKSQERLDKLLKRQKEGQKKVFSKMFG